LWSNIHRKGYSKFKPYEESKIFIHELGLKNYADWKSYLAGELKDLPQKPKDIPANPAGVYKDKGWIGIGDWLGTNAFPYAHQNYLSYKEARTYVRELGLTSSVEWVQYCKEELDWLSKKPSNIPANVVRKYEYIGWKGFKDFLASNVHRKNIRSFMKYTEAKKLVSKLGINTEKKYHEFLENELVSTLGKAPKNLPAEPRVIYRRQGWKGWKDFFA